MKVAVFLRGHKRTWDLIKKQNINFFHELGSEVHFYISVWEVGNVDSIVEDFPKNSIKVFEKNKQHKNFDAVTGPIFQSELLSKHKYAHELSNSKYDLVLETRFDVLFYNFDKEKFKNEILDYKLRLGSSKVYPLHAVGMDDHIFLMDSKTEVFWRSRIISLSKENSHKTFYEFAEHYDLKPYTIDWFSTIITRPNIKNIQNLSDQVILEKHLHEWNDNSIINLEKKLELLSQTRINLEEYYFQLENSL